MAQPAEAKLYRKSPTFWLQPVFMNIVSPNCHSDSVSTLICLCCALINMSLDLHYIVQILMRNMNSSFHHTFVKSLENDEVAYFCSLVSPVSDITFKKSWSTGT